MLKKQRSQESPAPSLPGKRCGSNFSLALSVCLLKVPALSPCAPIYISHPSSYFTLESFAAPHNLCTCCCSCSSRGPSIEKPYRLSKHLHLMVCDFRQDPQATHLHIFNEERSPRVLVSNLPECSRKQPSFENRIPNIK